MASQVAVPDLVAAPAHPGEPGSGWLLLEARESPDGAVLPVFSSVGGLVAVLGTAQPWAVLALNRVREMAAAAGVERVALDPAVDPGAWRWAFADLETFGQGRRER